MDEQLHSPARLLIELRMEHAELNGRIDMLTSAAQVDELSLRRLKKRRLVLRDQIAALQLADEPDEPA